MTITVFLGPTLSRADASEYLAAEFRGPAAMGDICRSALERPSAIVLIDGVFGAQPSVFHKEIVWAIDHGIAVHGCSSMGALRAAELQEHGMVGHGAIFDMFRTGKLVDDDEVAVMHAPREMGYRALTTAMVDVRASLARAVGAGIIDSSCEMRLLALGRRLHYTQRTYPALLAKANDAGISGCETLARWLPHNHVQQKAIDAAALLRALAAGSLPQRRSTGTARHFVRTEYWDAAFGAPVIASRLGVDEHSLIDEIRLRPALLRMVEPPSIQKLVNRLHGRKGAGGNQPATDAQARLVRERYRRSLNRRMIAEAGRLGLLDGLVARLVAKRKALAAPGREPTRAIAADSLFHGWRSRNRLGLSTANAHFLGIDYHARWLGYDETKEFEECLVGEHLFVDSHPMEDLPMSIQPAANDDLSRKWTVWLYMASQNDPKNHPDIDSEAHAQANVDQILSRTPLKRSSFHVLMDKGMGPKSFPIAGGGNKSDLGVTTINMSDPKSLVKFITSTPTPKRGADDNQMLILWGHGKGMVFLSDPDQDPQKDPNVMSVVDAAEALLGACRNKQKLNLKILGFDCCFMAHIETMHELAPIATYLVAGPAPIPIASWPYHDITSLVEDPYNGNREAEVAQGIAICAREYFLESGAFESPLLVFKSKKMAGAVDALNEIGEGLTELCRKPGLGDEMRKLLLFARRSARAHADAADYVEFESFVSEIADRLDRKIREDISVFTAQQALIGEIGKRIVTGIVAVRDCLVQPAPIRGASAPRSPIVWFPVNKSLFDKGRERYRALKSSKPKVGGKQTLAGWAQLIWFFHDQPVLAEVLVAEVTATNPLLMGVRGASQTAQKIRTGTAFA